MRTRLEIRRQPRSGFSLIELLVVMTIIAIVAAMFYSMLGATGATARKGATETTIRKVDSLLQARFKELREDFDEQERKKARADVTTAAAAKASWFNVMSNAEAMATKYPVYASTPLAVRIAVIKADRYRGAFPQRVQDLYGINNADDGGSYFDDSPLLDYWKQAAPIWNGVTKNVSAHQAPTESSELLYLTLASGKGTGASVNVLDDINPRHLKDSDGDGIPEIYDDWGNMLRFYNAPTRLVRPLGTDTVPSVDQYSVAEALISGLPRRPTTTAEATDFTNAFNQDPLDPKKALQQLVGPPGSRNATVAAFETLFHTPDTFYKLMIVSAGEDGDFGLGDPTSTGPERLAGPSTTDLTTAADNITNLQRLGGK